MLKDDSHVRAATTHLTRSTARHQKQPVLLATLKKISPTAPPATCNISRTPVAGAPQCFKAIHRLHRLNLRNLWMALWLTSRFVARNAVVGAGNFSFERGSCGDGFVVAEVAVEVISNFIRQLRRRRFVRVLHRG